MRNNNNNLLKNFMSLGITPSARKVYTSVVASKRVKYVKLPNNGKQNVYAKKNNFSGKYNLYKREKVKNITKFGQTYKNRVTLLKRAVILIPTGGKNRGYYKVEL